MKIIPGKFPSPRSGRRAPVSVWKLRAADRALHMALVFGRGWNRLLPGRFGVQTLGTVAAARVLPLLESRRFVGLVLFACILPLLELGKLLSKFDSRLLLLELRLAGFRSRLLEIEREAFRRDHFIP